jgi:hypothetical protein
LVIGDGHLGAVLASPSRVTEERRERESDKIKEMKERERTIERMTEVTGRKY